MSLNFLNKARQFWNETVTEVWHKSVWPKPKELAQSTAVVVTFIAILSSFVFVYDFSMHELVRVITRFIVR
jgi:preprotein translocase SecE subunit